MLTAEGYIRTNYATFLYKPDGRSGQIQRFGQLQFYWPHTY